MQDSKRIGQNLSASKDRDSKWSESSLISMLISPCPSAGTVVAPRFCEKVPWSSRPKWGGREANSSVGVSGPEEEEVDGPDESRDMVTGVTSENSSAWEKEKIRCRLIIENRRLLDLVWADGVGEGLRKSWSKFKEEHVDGRTG